MMMKRIIAIFLLSTMAFAVDNPYQEVMSILEKSKIKYNLTNLTSPVKAENRSDVLNATAYRVKTSKGFQVKGVNFAPEAKKIYLQAENLFSANKYEEARNLYKKVLLLSPENTFLMTLIAQTYGIERKFDDAMNWYKKSIQANFIDYLAHWLLADIYRLKGMKKEALNEIAIAKVLNRNNPRLEKLRSEIFALNGLSDVEWRFNPQIRIERTVQNNINIEADSVWTMYALFRAAWLNEPEYREILQKRSKRSNLEDWVGLEGLELVINQGMKGPEILKRLDDAFNADRIDEFVTYEITLVRQPKYAYYYEEDAIKALAEYLIWSCRKN